MSSIRWPAPAKLNLFLHINGRRPDGYHELQTLFTLLDYCDYLTITPLTGTSEVTVTPEIVGVAAEDNLIVRAARLLQPLLKAPMGAKIELEKRLPMGGGIGGGSSDAATTLVALNYQWGVNLSIDQLAELGVKLGADVPIFVRGHAAFAEGVGEALQSVELPKAWYLVLKPECHVSTAAIFQDPNLPRDTPKESWMTLAKGFWKNDCESLVKSRHPEVAKALSWLLEYAPSRMTGTGACVFATFEAEAEALALFNKLPAEFQGFVAEGLNESPLHTQLRQLRAASDTVL